MLGAAVTLMERSKVDTVLVAGKIRTWKGKMFDVDLPKLRGEFEASRDYLFKAAKIERDLFRSWKTSRDLIVRKRKPLLLE